ncbi:hypothetical protein GCM10009682_08760 [Luedemannella flava]|uniref:Uncharacterized protein n=1 Tax=Luedemannella flava TaxID=349316 RepID=A0ABP4XRN7_9ACTN
MLGGEEYAELISGARQMLTDGAAIDDVIRFLRECDVYMGDSIRILIRTGLVGVHEAKIAVVHSPVWLDTRAQQAALEEAAIDAVTRENQ